MTLFAGKGVQGEGGEGVINFPQNKFGDLEFNHPTNFTGFGRGQ